MLTARRPWTKKKMPHTVPRRCLFSLIPPYFLANGDIFRVTGYCKWRVCKHLSINDIFLKPPTFPKCQSPRITGPASWMRPFFFSFLMNVKQDVRIVEDFGRWLGPSLPCCRGGNGSRMQTGSHERPCWAESTIRLYTNKLKKDTLGIEQDAWLLSSGRYNLPSFHE